MLNIKSLFLSKEANFYYLLGLCLSMLLLTNPFLRYPYDIFYHLISIDKYYETLAIPNGRHLWHFIWAKFFYIFDISNSEVLFRAKIIHILQTYMAFFAVYYFSKVVIRNVFKKIDAIALKYLSFWSVVIWFSIFATFSMNYHLVWNLWYSVNYQITLPLFWYLSALTLVLFLENITIKKKIFFIVQIVILSRFILQAHSMEFLYYLMYMFVFVVIYLDKVFYSFKRYFYLMLPAIFAIWYFIKAYQPENSKFLII